MALTNKEKVVALIHSIESGVPQLTSYIDPNQYIQHNLAIVDGIAGFSAYLHALPTGSAKASVQRIFEDGPYVIVHTKYNLFGPKIGFNIFRFEDGLVREHWDNLQAISSHSISGRSQMDGSVTIADLDKTEQNKALVQQFVQSILVDGKTTELNQFIGPEPRDYMQHNPSMADGAGGLLAALVEMNKQGCPMVYTVNHAVFGEGNFVLSVSQGVYRKREVAFYDLFRIENDRLVEHWDSIEAIPPKALWKNSNGKFDF